MTTMVAWCGSRASIDTAVVCSGRKRPQSSKEWCEAAPRERRRVGGGDEAEQQLGAGVVQRGEPDLALRALDAYQTNDFYELVVERASTIVTSNREPSEWLTMTSDALLAQSAIDRLTSGAHTLVIEGPSYRLCDTNRRAALDATEQDQ